MERPTGIPGAGRVSLAIPSPGAVFTVQFYI